MRVPTVLIALLTLTLPAVAPAQDGGTRYRDPVFATVDVERDVVYGAAMNNLGELQSLEMDVYRPAGDAQPSRPAVLWVHGGSFKTGDRKSVAGTTTALAQRGYVAFSIGYRVRPPGTPGSLTNAELVLASATGYPDQIRDAQHDLQAAIRYVRAHAEDLGIDPLRIVAGGNSAGAITALEAAFNPEDPGESGTPGVSSVIAAAISISGTSDTRRIEPGMPPVQMFHGTNDTTVPFALAAQTCAGVTALLGVCEFHPKPGGGHAYGQSAFEPSVDFLCRHVVDGGC